MTTWTDVIPSTAGYVGDVKGKLYSGNKSIYSGALTIRVSGEDIAFYAGYIGTGIEWTDVSPDTTEWSDV